MLKINLCPIDELESRYWYLPDLALVAILALVSHMGVQRYLSGIEAEISAVEQATSSLKESYTRLAPDLGRFATLDQDVATLNTKLQALRSITVSKIAKYKPVIALEHIHNLLPAGLWLWSIKIDEQDKVDLEGQSLDNLLVAEFITNLRSTATASESLSDLRTRVHFSDLKLIRSVRPEAPNANFPEFSKLPQYTITGKITERDINAIDLEIEAVEKTLDLSKFNQDMKTQFKRF